MVEFLKFVIQKLFINQELIFSDSFINIEFLDLFKNYIGFQPSYTAIKIIFNRILCSSR